MAAFLTPRTNIPWNKTVVDKLMEKRGFKDREKGAYERLLEYEVQQYLQEQTRESLGPPFGRAAPLKLYNLTDSGREGLTTPPASLKYLSFDSPRTGELSSARSLEETPLSYRTARGLKLQPLKQEWSVRSLHSRGQPFQQFPATNKPLIYSSSDTLISEAEYQFKTPFGTEIASFNPFQRPRADNYFFPPDMFLDEDYLSMAEQLPMPGQGRWKCSDGSILWKPCTVLSYSEESRCFEVQWTESKARKFLPRWNLLLGDETEETFDRRMRQVKDLRMNHEGFVRYFGRFELALAGTVLKKSPAFVRSEHAILSKLNRSLAPRQEVEVRKELWELYRRCVFKFIFDSQYFYEKVQLAACPWEHEYAKQTKWRDYLRGQVAGKRTFKVAQKTVLDRYLNPNNPLDGPRQRIYRLLTVIRTGNYYEHLRKLRSQTDTLTTNKLNYEFRNHFSADLRLIDSTIKQITDFLSKMLEDDRALEAVVDKYLHIAHIVLESNLQYAVKQSVHTLIGLFQEYYPMLPLPGEMARGLQHLPEDVKARHFGQTVPSCVPMGVLESTKLLKEVIEVLEADFRSGRLSRYGLEKVIPPLVTVSIESKVTKAALDLGKAIKLFDLQVSLQDRQQRRSKLQGLPAASTTVIQVANQSALFSKLMLRSDECSITAQEPAKANKHILNEEVFGWMSAGVDDLNLVLTPSIEEVEYGLRTLAKAPLANLRRIRKLKRNATEHEHITAKNAKALLQLALREVSSVLQFSLYAPVALLAILRHFEYLFSSSPQDLFEAVVTSHIDDYPGFVQEIETISRHKALIEANLPLALHFGMLQVHLKGFKTEAVRNAQILMDTLLAELSLEHLGILREVHSSFESLMEMLIRTPESVEELGDLQDFLHHRKDEAIIKEINAELQKVVFIYEALERFNTAISEEQSELWWRTKSWGGIIKKEKGRLYKRLQKLTPIFRDSVQKDIQELKLSAETLKSDITNFVTYNDIQKAEMYAAKAHEITESLGTVKSAIALANSREQRLGYLPTNFTDLVKMEEQFLVFNALWSFANEWALAYMGWMDKPLHLIDPTAVRKKFRKGKDLLTQLRVDLAENLNAMNAIEDLTSQILAFESTVPLLSNLREECLRDRHWKRIWDSLGRTTSDKPESERRETQTLRDLLMAGVLKRAKDIEAITQEAKHEFEIEKIWTGIEREVRNPAIELVALPKHPELQLLGHLAELRDSLREAFTTISYIVSANRYIEPFRESLRSLSGQITSQKTMVDDLYEFQALLEELYPIFKLQEVCEQQPRTAAQMQELLSYYARQLKLMQESHSFAVSSEGPLKTLSDAFQALRTIKEEVGKKLAEKQSLNSRLYFLTNLQLLTLMSQILPQRSVDVEELFPGIEEIVLGERAVTKIVRSQETFDLPKRVVIFMENGSPRNTEEWLADLDSSLKDFHCRRVLGQYKQFSTAGVTWESGADNEAIYIAYMAWFTRQVNYALRTDNSKEGLLSLRETLQKVLGCGIEVMKPSHGTPGHGVIATIVRNQFVRRDETLEKKKYNEMLAHMLIAHMDLLDQIISGEEQDFGLAWKSAFKVNATVGDSWDSLALNIDCFDYVVPYGFEMHSLTYLQSFILTPSSERRLQHIFLTMKHGLGCLLAGSAGSEKTETLKHLALMCGRLLPICHITSTTPQEKVVKFIVGCAVGGFWGCIDEIQALPEVSLCTVLYYLKQISAAAVPNPPRVSIDCYKFKPKLGFAMFSTSSAADPALPQSFHEQFRTLAVSRPDLGTTAAILLQTYGFERANKYGGMIAKAMQLLETPILSLSTGVTLNLSTKANTRTLVRLVRCMIDIAMRHYINDMPYLINNSFRQIYGLGLLSSHLAILDEFLATLFQSTHNDIVAQIKSRSVSEQILQVISQEKVAVEEAMQLRCQHLWWLLFGARRPWVALVGEPLSGKSEIIKLLAKVVASLHGSNFKVHRLGAAAPLELLSELYESLANSTNHWFSSELQTNFCSESAIPGETAISPLDWIHVDAYSLPYTSDSLFTLIKSHPKADIRVIFESERLEAASPSILYEAGILFVEEAEIDQFTYFQIRMQQVVPESLATYSAVLLKMYTTVLVPVLAYVASAPVTLKLCPKGAIQQFSNLFKGFLPLLATALKKDDETATVPLSKANSALVILKHATFFTKNTKETVPKHKSILNNPRSIGASVLKYLGGMRKVGSHLKPELCLEALFLTCVMHGLGRLMVNADGFSAMLGGIVLRQTEDFGHFLQKELREGTSVLTDLVFSMQSLAWIRVVSTVSSSPARKTSLRTQVEVTPSMYDSAGVHLNIFSLDMGAQNIVVGTESCKRLSYWVEFCLSQGVDILVYGPHQCGKTLITNTVAKEMLNSTSCALIPFNVSEFTHPQAVQESLQSAMEHYRTFNYGGLGGTRYIAILDDMNMDASHQLYDLFRFWKETGGWYGENFVKLEDLTLALVHSYSEGKSRPMWLRAVRHFLVVHKESYLDTEITAIFRKFVDAQSEEDSPESLSTVIDFSLMTLIELYRELQLQHKRSEQIWCHLSISNFMLALKFLSQFDLSDEVDVETYLKVWTFMYTRFFGDQFGEHSQAIGAELQAIINQNLSGLIEKLIDNKRTIHEISQEGFMLPSASELQDAKPGLFHEFELMYEDSIANVIVEFHAAHKKCVQLYPQLLKNLHSLIFQIEHRFSVFYYFFLSTIYDIKSSCPSIIIKSASQLFLIKALVYISAETLNVKVIEFSMGEQENSFGEHMIDSFRTVSPHHVPTEVRYAVKHIVEQAMIQDQKIVILISLFSAKQLDRPLSQKLMEISNDIITGVQLRLTGFGDIYKSFVDKFRSSDEHKLKHYHSNEEVLQLMLDRMKMNTTIIFLIQAENQAWIRSPLHPVGILEKFKHEYRSVFNKSRIVDFDHLKPPQAFENYLMGNPRLLKEWKLDFHNDLLIEIGEQIAKMLNIDVLEEFAYECVIYCASKLIQEMDTRKQSAEQTYLKALSQISALDKAVESAPNTILALEEEAKKVELQLQAQKEKRSRLEAAFARELTHDYTLDYQEDLRQQRVAALQVYEELKHSWTVQMAEFTYKHEEVKDVEKSLGNSSFAYVIFLFSLLLSPQEVLTFPPDPDTMEPYLRKFLSQLSKKGKEMLKRLRKLEPEDIPDIQNPLTSLELGSLSRVPRLIRVMHAALEGSQRARLAYEQMMREGSRVDEECGKVTVKVEEKVKQIRARQAIKMARVQGKIAKTHEKLSQLMKDIEQITVSKPKLQKLVSDLKLNSESWKEALSSDTSLVMGDCILSSFLILKGMSSPKAVRDKMATFIIEVMTKYHFPCQQTTSLSWRLMGSNKTFLLECGRKGLPESVFFHDNAAALQTVQRLRLPFPLFYDPYEIAAEYIVKTEADTGLLVGKVSNDVAFERKLRESVVEGRPVLCIDPSVSLLKAILPILSWKSQHFVALMRGVDPAGIPLVIASRHVAVHPNFRLYIACRQLPNAEVLQLVTLINFDAYDEDSWQAFTLRPLLRTLDDHQFQGYVTYLEKQHEQMVAIEEAEAEILALLNTNNMDRVIVSEQLLDSFFKAWRKMRLLPLLSEEDLLKTRRSSFLAKEKSSAELRSPLLSPTDPSPREKLHRLLSEMYDFKQTLSMCNSALEDYAVPEKLLHVMVLNSVQEYVRTIAVPVESQYEAFADCMAYRVYVRISNSLSKEAQLVFTAFYSFYKDYKLQTLSKEEYLKALEAIVRLREGKHTQSDNIAYLQTQFPSLFSPYFSPGSPAFAFFLTRELFTDAKVPEALPAVHKYLAYAYLRPELLSDFMASAAHTILGPRFSWFPKINLDMYTSDQTQVPTLFFFQEASPAPLLRYMAEARKVTLVPTQPVLDITVKTGKTEIRKIGRSVNSILTTITENFGSSRWVIIENLHSVTGLEAEVVTKFLLYKLPEEGGDNLRIWVLFQGRPGDHPQWANLMKQCQRVVMPEPGCIRDEMLLWHYTNTGAFFLHYRNFVSRRYWNHSALDTQESPTKRSKQVGRRTSATTVESNEELQPQSASSANPKEEIAFNASLLFCILHYRAKYHKDLPFLWKRTDAKRLLEDFLACLPQDMVSKDLLNPKILALFCSLLAPQFSSYAHALIISLLKEVALSRRGVLAVKPRDDCPPFTPIEYPLYQIEHISSEFNLEILLNRYPSEDHLLVTGLKHQHTVAVRLALVQSLLEPAAVLRRTLAGDVSVGRDLSRDQEKLELARKLGKYLTELLEILPTSVKVKSLSRDNAYSNVFTKSGHSYKAALAHTKDGFKLSDMRNSILDRPPSLLDVLEVLEVAEAGLCNSFLGTVRKSLVEMHQYLGYGRSTLSEYDLACLADLASNQVPGRWRELSPFVCRAAASAEEWKSEIALFFSKSANWTTIDLTRLFAPSLMLDAILRAAAVSFKKHFEVLSFSVDFAPQTASLTSKFQITVTGLSLLNAGLNPANCLLVDTKGEALLPCQLSPIKLPKTIRDCPYYPEGMKLLAISKMDLKGRRQDLASQVSGLLGRRSSNLVLASDYVFVPVELASPPFWLLISSLKPQGHWSKKGTLVRLKSSKA